MDKKGLSERDICTKFITPALRKAGWDEMVQVREEVSFTKGRIIVRGKLVSRGKGKRADYILYYKPNVPIALIEAKDNTHAVGDGMQQGLDYADTLKIPFVFSSNGDGFVFHDRTGASAEKETAIALDAFPSPDDLWARYRAWKGLTPEAEAVVLQDYFDDGGGTTPRYYQVNAINAAIEAIAKGGDRILLVMATGTGKTYTAFQIIWRLWKAGRKKRILFLARSQRAGRPDHGQRLPALRRGDGQAVDQSQDHRTRGRLIRGADRRPLAGKRVLLHGHCHQKAFGVMPALESALRLIPELEVETVASSCCGMAGAFGYEAENYETSMAMGELNLLPAVREADPGTLIVASGTSCRHQIADGAGRDAWHVARVLERALP